jgi:GT2 family glycosyltransferase
MTQELPTVTVIVLNWNGREYLSDGFASLMTLEYPKDHLELMRVDNGSSDDSMGFVRQHYPHVTIVETGRNLGFAGGNNAGVRVWSFAALASDRRSSARFFRLS